MIDTDKYEGHSTEYSYEIVSVDDDKEMDATYALLNDAPLLLEEVKRLREETKWFRERLCRHIGYDYCKSEYEKHFGREMIE
jgi:predicted acetyltransferase